MEHKIFRKNTKFIMQLPCGLISHGMLNGKVVEGVHEKMITKETFMKVNEVISSSPKLEEPMCPKILSLCFRSVMNPDYSLLLAYYYCLHTQSCKAQVKLESIVSLE